MWKNPMLGNNIAINFQRKLEEELKPTQIEALDTLVAWANNVCGESLDMASNIDANNLKEKKLKYTCLFNLTRL